MASTRSVDAAQTPVAPPPADAAPRIGHYRWVICALLFFASTINYVDRQVIGILEKDLRVIIGWTPIDYGNIVAAFNAAYALGLLGSRRGSCGMNAPIRAIASISICGRAIIEPA